MGASLVPFSSFKNKIYNKMERVAYTSEIVKSKRPVESGMTDVCFTVVFQPRKGGKEQENIVWHVAPGQHILSGGREEIYGGTITRIRKQEEARRIRELLEGGENVKIGSDTVYSHHPEAVVDGILGYLRRKWKGAGVSVTILPGRSTLKEGVGIDGLSHMIRILRERKERGLIKNLRSRGIRRGKEGSVRVVVRGKRILRRKRL